MTNSICIKSLKHVRNAIGTFNVKHHTTTIGSSIINNKVNCKSLFQTTSTRCNKIKDNGMRIFHFFF